MDERKQLVAAGYDEVASSTHGLSDRAAPPLKSYSKNSWLAFPPNLAINQPSITRPNSTTSPFENLAAAPVALDRDV